jgi:hypothetical protein
MAGVLLGIGRVLATRAGLLFGCGLLACTAGVALATTARIHSAALVVVGSLQGTKL